MIDFTGRLGSIHNEYKSGGDWEREMFIESTSFAFSATAGLVATRAGLGLLLLATPYGWMGLVIGGLVMAGVSAAVSIEANKISKENAGQWYDSLMRFLGVR